MRCQGTRLELWMKLGTHEERMSFKLNDFYQLPVWRSSGKLHTFLGKPRSVLVVEFVAMTVALANLQGAIRPGYGRP